VVELSALLSDLVILQLPEGVQRSWAVAGADPEQGVSSPAFEDGTDGVAAEEGSGATLQGATEDAEGEATEATDCCAEAPEAICSCGFAARRTGRAFSKGAPTSCRGGPLSRRFKLAGDAAALQEAAFPSSSRVGPTVGIGASLLCDLAKPRDGA